MRVHMLAATIAALPLAATADEVWYNWDGELVYETDLADYAVISAPRGEETIYLYVKGLPGNTSERGQHSGFWIGGPQSEGCDTALVGPDGRASYAWGGAIVMFDDPAFPTGFSVILGTCFDAPDTFMRANLAAG